MREMSLTVAAGMLGVSVGATLGEIQKAYRLRVMECHPDKKPMDPIAAEKFRNLGDARTVLESSAQMYGEYSVRPKTPAITLYDQLVNYIKRFDLKPLNADAQEKLNLLDAECQSLKRLQVSNEADSSNNLDVIKQRLGRLMAEFQAAEWNY